MEVSVDVTRAGDSVGPASVPVGVALDATGVDAGVGSVVGVSDASVGAGVAVSGVGDGVVVASGVGELAGNGVVAALRPGVAARTACSAADVPGLGADVAASMEAGTVATASTGAGICSPQASRAARITRIADTAASVLLPLIRALTI